MVTHADHVTLAVTDLAEARRFFGLLGFVHERSVVIAGEPFASYMDVPGLAADHVTLVLAGADPRFEIQLLRYHAPRVTPAPDVARLDRIGLNHLCFAVDDMAATLARLREGGVAPHGDALEFHGRRLVFLRGPDGVTIELSERRG